MRFIALDLETSNSQLSRICQIGVVTFEDGREVDAEGRLVDPQDYFDPSFNVDIHPITEDQVRGAPRFPDLHSWLRKLTSGEVLAHHSHFDRTALRQACKRYDLDPLQCNWLDTLWVARRAWPELPCHKLKHLGKHFGIDFQHHDAVDDARTAGLILLRATEETGHTPLEWIERSKSRSRTSSAASIRREEGEEGPLVGESIVFTGTLQIPRRDAADMAHMAGAAVKDYLTRKTTILVVGDQDVRKLAGHTKGAKHRKAEKLIAAGQPLRILCEADFLSVCEEEA